MSDTARIIRRTAVLVAMPLGVAMAQTQPLPSSPTTPPAATTPQAPAAAPQPTLSAQPTERKFASPDFVDLVGITAKSSDGKDLGKLHSVMANGKTTIGVSVSSFLGLGGHLVAIPDGKYARVGDTVQINMTAQEIQALPRAVEQK